MMTCILVLINIEYHSILLNFGLLQYEHYLQFEILIVVIMDNVIFWDMLLCGLVEKC
jgi:hypothetical protein